MLLTTCLGLSSAKEGVSLGGVVPSGKSPLDHLKGLWSAVLQWFVVGDQVPCRSLNTCQPLLALSKVFASIVRNMAAAQHGVRAPATRSAMGWFQCQVETNGALALCVRA